MRLARRRDVPRGVRARLYIAVCYNAQPVNPIPDFIPIVGMMDNVAVLGRVLRHALRTVDPAVLRDAGPGDDAGYERALRLVGDWPGRKALRHLLGGRLEVCYSEQPAEKSNETGRAG